jgi:hypothetical protein
MEDNQYLVSSFGDLNFTLFTRDGDVVKEDREKPEDGELAMTEMHIFRTGTYKHPLYGLISFTKEDLEEIIRNFKKNVVTEEIPLNENHMKRKPAKGWLARKENALKMRPIEVKSPDGESKREMGLFGDIALNKDGYECVVNHKYKYLSAEINQDYQHRDVNLGKKKENSDDEEDSAEIELKSYGTALTGIALTNNPFIPNLNELDFSDNKSPEDIDSDYIGCDSEYGSDVKFVLHENKAKDILDGSDNFEFNNVDNNNQESSDNNEQESENTNSNTSQNLTNTGDFNMEFADIVTKLREFDENDYEKQIDFLEDKKAESDDKAFCEAMGTLIEEKEEAKRQYNKAQKAVQREQRYKKQKEQLEDQVSELELNNQRLQEQSWQHRVEEFCTELEQEGHHQSIVNAIDNKFSSLTKDARETKLEFVDESDEGQKLDVIELTREILSEMPDSARLNEDEELQANQDVVDPDKGAEQPEQEDAETSDSEDSEDKQEADFELDIDGAEKIHNEDGELDFSKIRELK